MIIDTDFSCRKKSALLLSKGVTTVGRYYCAADDSYKLIQSDEAKELSASKIKIFVVYEDVGQKNQLTLSKDQGIADAKTALKRALDIKQPPDSAIYFAVEGLPDGYTTQDIPNLRDYFSGIKQTIGGRYAIGVYGGGVVCKTMFEEGYCKFTWLAAASTSFEGTCKFFGGEIPSWDLAQVPPLNMKDAEGWTGLSVDIDLNNPRRNGGVFGAFLVPV
jgi:hypothetical protein